MNIVHIAPCIPYNDYWGYQENLLPKYHKKLGHNVTVITTNTMFQNGKEVEIPTADYTLSDGIRVIRRKKIIMGGKILSNLKAYMPIYSYLAELKPDLIFFHGLISYTIFDAIRYKKILNKNCIIAEDNHIDYFNCYKSNFIANFIIRAFYRRLNRKAIPYVDKVFGVTPWRQQFAEDYFRIPPEKTDLLIMGADDEKIDFENRFLIREKIRKQYDIKNDEFLIVTGGKIDNEKNIHLLAEAVKGKPRVKLLVFGEVIEEFKSEFEKAVNGSGNIITIGWIDADKVYDYFFAADLCFFPGGHSVLWEQACASKVPCVFKKWDGMEHVNNGGNSDFISPVTVDTISEKIDELVFTEKYEKMKAVALSDATDIYLYGNIAKYSLSQLKTE